MFFVPLASSTFTGANEVPLSEGGVWTTSSGLVGFDRNTNTAIPDTVGSDCGSHYTGITFPANQYSRANLTVTGTVGGGSGIGLRLRQASGANTGYRFAIDHAASNNAQIVRSTAGALVTLITWTQAFTDGDQFTFAVDGMTVYVFDKNGLEVARFRETTAAVISTGAPGLFYSSTETSASLDNWDAGLFSFAALGSSMGNSAHPGRSPGYAPASFRFWMPSEIGAGAVVSPDVTLALTGVASTTGRGTVAVQHTNALTGVSETSLVGTVKANTTKALSGVSTTTSVGSLGVQRTKALSGVQTVTARGTLASSRTVPITGVQATGSVGTVIPTTGTVVALTGVSSSTAVGSMVPSVTVTLTGVSAAGAAGTLTPAGVDTVSLPVSKFRYIVPKGALRRRKSSHRELEELLDRIFTPESAIQPAPTFVEQAAKLVKPFVYRNELDLGKLEKDMRATRALLDLWTAETARMRAEDEDDDETILLME